MATSYAPLNRDKSRKCLFTIVFLCCIGAFLFGCLFLSFRIRYDVKQIQNLKKFSQNAVETKCSVEKYYVIEKGSMVVVNSPSHNELYGVKYQLANQSLIQSTIHRKIHPPESDKQINFQYSCFYDATNVTRVVWELEQASAYVQSIIYMSIGLGIMTLIFGFILFHLVQALL